VAVGSEDAVRVFVNRTDRAARCGSGTGGSEEYRAIRPLDTYETARLGVARSLTLLVAL
jgi:hypothetical protein